MERLIERKIGRTFSKYELIENRESNQQNSYNLSLEVMHKLQSVNAIEEFEQDHYMISSDYHLILGENILMLIDESSDEERNVIFTHTLANDGTEKFQIKRTDNLSNEMSWFGKLYDKNCKDSIFVIDLDETNHKIIMENYLPDEFFAYIGKIPAIIDDGNIPYETIILNLKSWMERLPIENKKMASLTAYIFQYAKSIINSNVSAERILNDAELETTLTPYVNVALTLYKAVVEGKIIVGISNNKTDKTVKNNDSKNIILYGVPGCGKSFTISRDYCSDKNYIERIVFHPDYSYADFVGQILPDNKNGTISYPFKPGPFTRILKKATEDPEHQYFLIIEEINRGNAPAIFGDVFQLLDRNSSGESVYTIYNADIAKEVYNGDENHEVCIPSNLSLLATMNTADQNVFTLDTAFKRRWQLKCIENNIASCDFAEQEILESKVTWKEFVTKINKLIIDESDKSLGSEDKRIGSWFVSSQDLTEADLFSEKVFLYLWNDVFKYKHEEIFNLDLLSGENTLEALIRKFKEVYFDVFNKNKITFEQLDILQIDDYPEVDSNYLSNKNQQIVPVYTTLVQYMKDNIPSFKDVAAGKDIKSAYIQFRANDIKRNSFADVGILKRNPRIDLTIQLPSKEIQDRLIQDELGEVVGTDHFSHPFKITITKLEDLTDDVKSAVLESYKTLQNK